MNFQGHLFGLFVNMIFFRLYGESKVKFLSNESTATREKFVQKLEKLGFELKPEDLITPAPSCAKYIREHNLRPHLLVHDGEFLTSKTSDYEYFSFHT